MASEHHYFSGKGSWIKHIAPDKFNRWGLQLYPDADSYNRILELKNQGLKNVIKKDEDGYNVYFGRPASKEIKGRVRGFNPPLVLQADGKTPYTDQAIGNGSDVTIKVEIYQYKAPGAYGEKGIAARLETIRIDNLVPFKGESFDKDQAEQAKGVDEVPKPIF